MEEVEGEDRERVGGAGARPMCTLKHVTFDTEGACFPGGTPILPRKVAFGPRARAKSRRTPRYFRRRNQARKGIRTYIYKT